jgi:protein-L-isoaspartate(D-aspartate) O-methyltransferase
MELPAGGGRTLLRPRDLAKLLQALAPKAGENAMEIAGASGYGAAILAQIGLSVTMLEPDPDLCRAARAALEASGIGASVTVVSTDVRQGWSEAAPYDVIMLNGAAEEVPSVWLDQLAEGGRMGVIVREGPAGSARLYTKANGVVSYRIAFDAAPPVAPGVSSPKVFSF